MIGLDVRVTEGVRHESQSRKRLAVRADGVGGVELVRRAYACLREGGDDEIRGGTFKASR